MIARGRPIAEPDAMHGVFGDAMDLIERFSAAASAAEAGRLFRDALRPYGLFSLYAGAYPLAIAAQARAVTEASHTFVRFSPAGWQDAYRTLRLDAGNPVILGPPRLSAAFRWRDSGLAATQGWKGFGVARDVGLEDGLAVPIHGPDGYVAVVSMGFAGMALSPRELKAIEIAAIALHQRLHALSPPPAPRAAARKLSPRERDCMAFVAMGLADWEIAEKIGVAESTARAHAENAKRKLGARTRPQAVAMMAALGLI